MTEPLFELAAEPRLSERQRRALDFIAANNGVTVDEIGAHLHSFPDRHRPHSADERCEWCGKDGRSVVTSIALKPLVTFRRDKNLGHLYVIKGQTSSRDVATKASQTVGLPGKSWEDIFRPEAA